MSRTYVAEADVLVVRSTRNLRRWDWELYTVWRDENANTTMTFNYERSDVIFDNLIRYQLLGLCDVRDMRMLVA